MLVEPEAEGGLGVPRHLVLEADRRPVHIAHKGVGLGLVVRSSARLRHPRGAAVRVRAARAAVLHGGAQPRANEERTLDANSHLGEHSRGQLRIDAAVDVAVDVCAVAVAQLGEWLEDCDANALDVCLNRAIHVELHIVPFLETKLDAKDVDQHERQQRVVGQSEVAVSDRHGPGGRVRKEVVPVDHHRLVLATKNAQQTSVAGREAIITFRCLARPSRKQLL